MCMELTAQILNKLSLTILHALITPPYPIPRCIDVDQNALDVTLAAPPRHTSLRPRRVRRGSVAIEHEQVMILWNDTLVEAQV